MADSEVPADDARMIDGSAGYPVDGIKDQTPRELHQTMKNLSVKVALGFGLPCATNATWHGHEIPAGYARVGVDEIMPGFETLELDIPGGDEEKTLGEVKLGFVLWNKKHIMFPDSAPRPPTPPSSNPPQSPSLPAG